MKALEYCKALSDTFIPGVASWNDSSNNKAFLSGELYMTGNGISFRSANSSWSSSVCADRPATGTPSSG